MESQQKAILRMQETCCKQGTLRMPQGQVGDGTRVCLMRVLTILIATMTEVPSRPRSAGFVFFWVHRHDSTHSTEHLMKIGATIKLEISVPNLGFSYALMAHWIIEYSWTHGLFFYRKHIAVMDTNTDSSETSLRDWLEAGPWDSWWLLQHPSCFAISKRRTCAFPDILANVSLEFLEALLHSLYYMFLTSTGLNKVEHVLS